MDADHDVRALARFEVFLFAAVATVLVTRTILAATGYPQVGGSSKLHIAHVLWGGLLMAVAIVLVETVPGTRVGARAAFIGGIGFGLFLDEVGKFVTKDVDYFFKPAIAIMYAVFVGFYVVVRAVLQRRRLTDQRRLALAIIALADLTLGQLDVVGRDYAVRLLDGVSPTSELRPTADLVHAGLLARPPRQAGIEAWLTRRINTVELWFGRVLASRFVQRAVIVVFIVLAIDDVLTVVVSIIRHGSTEVGRIVLDTGIPGAITGALIIAGVVRLRTNRESGLRWLQWAVLIDLLITQVTVFYREQWLGLVGFAINLVVLAALGQALRAASVDPTLADSAALLPS